MDNIPPLFCGQEVLRSEKFRMNAIRPMRCYYRLVCWAFLLLGIENPAAQGAGFRELPVPGGMLAGPQIGSQHNPAAATNGSVVLVMWGAMYQWIEPNGSGPAFFAGREPLDPVAVDISTVRASGKTPSSRRGGPAGGRMLVAWESKAAGFTVAALRLRALRPRSGFVGRWTGCGNCLRRVPVSGDVADQFPDRRIDAGCGGGDQ